MRKVTVIVLALTVLAIGAMPASAGDDEVIRRGSCSGRTDWKLKVKTDDGGLEVEFEVDQNVVGDVWRIRVRHEGDVIFAGRRTTRGASGSFSVELRTADHAGGDRFVARARNVSTGEVCRGTLTY
jgi:hypothetical protein